MTKRSVWNGAALTWAGTVGDSDTPLLSGGTTVGSLSLNTRWHPTSPAQDLNGAEVMCTRAVGAPPRWDWGPDQNFSYLLEREARDKSSEQYLSFHRGSV